MPKREATSQILLAQRIFRLYIGTRGGYASYPVGGMCAVTPSGTAGTMGSWAECIPANTITVPFLVTAIGVDADGTLNSVTTQIGTGSAGSEVVRGFVWTWSYSVVTAMRQEPIIPAIQCRANERIALRGTANDTSTTSRNFILYTVTLPFGGGGV